MLELPHLKLPGLKLFSSLKLPVTDLPILKLPVLELSIPELSVPKLPIPELPVLKLPSVLLRLIVLLLLALLFPALDRVTAIIAAPCGDRMEQGSTASHSMTTTMTPIPMSTAQLALRLRLGEGRGVRSGEASHPGHGDHRLVVRFDGACKSNGQRSEWPVGYGAAVFEVSGGVERLVGRDHSWWRSAAGGAWRAHPCRVARGGAR